MTHTIVERTDGTVTVSPLPGHNQEFKDAAVALRDAGTVRTVTGSRGIALQASEDVAVAAGIIKTKASATRRKSSTRRKKDQ